MLNNIYNKRKRVNKPYCQGTYYMDSKEITQKIKVNNKGEVSIIADNVDIFHTDCTRIDGDFKISAEDLCRLIPMLDKNYAGWGGRYIMTREKATDLLIKEKEELQEKLKERNDKVEELYDRESDLKDLNEDFKDYFSKIPTFILRIFLKKEEVRNIKQNK